MSQIELMSETTTELMNQIDAIAERQGIEVSTYPATWTGTDRCVLSMRGDSELPEDFLEMLEDEGIVNHGPYGEWPCLYGYAE
jgi:hypothetical protein